MLKFDMAEDPEDLTVRTFGGPHTTNVLVIGDFLERLDASDASPLEDRRPPRVSRENLAKVRRGPNPSGRCWTVVERLLENTPAEVQIEVLNASKDDLVADFDDASTLFKSGFFKLANMYNHQGMRPYSLLVMLDAVDAPLLRQLGAVARYKNLPILIEGTAAMNVASPEARFIVPCLAGSALTAVSVLKRFASTDTPPPNVTTCAETSLSSLLLLTHFAHRLLHIDYRRGCPSQNKDASAMTDILNGGFAARLRNLPGVSARVSGFEWQQRPYAEATLSVTTPSLSVEDRILLQFEFG